MTEPRRITITTVWVADGHPVMCRCGHLHFPRYEHVDGRKTNLAAQWTWCEDPECPCRGLRILEDKK